MAHLLGVTRRRAAWVMRHGDHHLPRTHARRLSEISVERGRAYLALAADLAAWADRPVERVIKREARGG